MTLTADKRGRLTCPQLFRPGAVYEADTLGDGTIRIRELGPGAVRVVHTKRVNGDLIIAGWKPSPGEIAAAIRADRDAR